MLQFALLLAVVVGALSVLGPVVAENELGGAKAWGLILTAQAVGLLVGALLGLAWRPRRMLLAATLGVLLWPSTLLALGGRVSLPLIMAAAFVAGIGLETFILL